MWDDTGDNLSVFRNGVMHMSKQAGLFDKFELTRVDGKPIEPEAEYFVLRLDNDSDAVRAIMSWAVLTGKGKLFDDLVDKYIGGTNV